MAEESTRLRLRQLTLEDYPALARLMDQVYHDIGGAWPEETIATLIRLFPEGQLAIEDNGNLVATALTVKVSYDRFSNPHRYEDLITEEMLDAIGISGTPQQVGAAIRERNRFADRSSLILYDETGEPGTLSDIVKGAGDGS